MSIPAYMGKTLEHVGLNAISPNFGQEAMWPRSPVHSGLSGLRFYRGCCWG